MQKKLIKCNKEFCFNPKYYNFAFMETEFDYKKALRETDLKTKAIARKMGISDQTVRNWRSGMTFPSKADLALLKQILNPYID